MDQKLVCPIKFQTLLNWLDNPNGVLVQEI
jgi:hypothetical protein